MAFTDAEALAYIASYADLRQAIGPDAEAGRRHFELFGRGEGRSILFDPLAYIATYPDLIRAFGDDAAAGARHFINFGASEGRSPDFDALAYIATYSDLSAALGASAAAGARHFVRFGFTEGRAVDFDALRYIASNPDLIAAFGVDGAAGARHFIQVGRAEGRATATFDPLSYAAAYPDLINAFGADRAAVTAHFLRFGFAEGRTARFDPEAYWLANPDLAAAGLRPSDSLAHYFNFGFREGRTALPFEDAQRVTSAQVGRAVRETLSAASDQDYFTIDLTGDELLRVNLIPAGADLGALRGATIELRDAANRLVESNEVFGPIPLAWATFVAPQTGSYTLVVRAPTSLSGSASYQLAIAREQVTFTNDIVTFDGDNGDSAVWASAPLSDELRVIEAGAGDDILSARGRNVVLRGGVGADVILADATNVAMMTYTTSPTGVVVHLGDRTASGGHADGDRFLGINAVRGSRLADQLTGSAGGNTIEGLDGDDLIVGLDGNDFLWGGFSSDPNSGRDTLLGGAGDDLLSPGDGADVVDGGPGVDRLLFLSDASVRVDLRSGLAQGGEADGDTYTAIESIIIGVGYTGADVLATTPGGGALSGSGGDDILLARGPGLIEGGPGRDLLVGRGRMLGGDGDDTIVGLGGLAEIELNGGSGADTLIVSTALHPGGSAYQIAARLALGDAGDRIDLSGFRDADGTALTFGDVAGRLAATGGFANGFAVQRLSMTGLQTTAGDAVGGYLDFIAPFEETQFVFSGGLNWQPLVPSDFPVT